MNELFKAKYYEMKNAYAFHKSYNNLLFRFDTRAKFTMISFAALLNYEYWTIKRRIELESILNNSSFLKTEF